LNLLIKNSLLFLILFSELAFSQIADSSFFSSVRSVNPGVAHGRLQGLATLDASQQNIEKKHDVTAGGIVGGINSEVEIQKSNLFYASRGGSIAFELLANMSTGKSSEKINSTTAGERNIENNAKSNFYGGILDLKYLGFSYSAASYNTNYQFRIGDPPNVSARDIKTNIDYSLLKVGTAFKISGFTFGIFGMDKKSDEDRAYTYYDPTTGNKGTTELYPATSQATGYGVGLGYTAKNFRIEIGTEQLSKPKFKYDEDPLEIIKQQTASSRTGITVEARFGKLSLGASVKNNVGNYTDLDDLIMANLVYAELSASDSRLETSFNFGYGADKGLSFSAFYTQSEAKTEEETIIFPGNEYPAVTKSSAFGGNITYYF